MDDWMRIGEVVGEWLKDRRPDNQRGDEAEKDGAGDNILEPAPHDRAAASERSTYTLAVWPYVVPVAMRIPQIGSAQRDISERGSKVSRT